MKLKRNLVPRGRSISIPAQRGFPRAALCVVLFCAACSLPLAAGQQSEAKDAKESEGDSAPVRVNYSSVVGYPDTPVEISFYLTASVPVSSLESVLHFQKGLVELMKVRGTDILESEGNFSVDGKIEDDPKNPAQSLFRLRIQGDAGEKKPLPSGLLAFVTFKVGGGVKDGDHKLSHEVTALDAASKPIAGAVAETLLLSIYPKGINPYLNCFFFNH